MGEAIVGAMVGDYLLQNDFLADRKSKPGIANGLVCLLHCLLWTAAVLGFSGWWLLPDPERWQVAAWLLGTHFVIDRHRLAARLMPYLGQGKFLRDLGPWSSIVVDNTWHLVTIWLAWFWLLMTLG